MNSVVACIFPGALWMLIGLAIRNQETRAQVIPLLLAGVIFGLLLSIPLAICLARIWFRLVVKSEGIQIRSVRRGLETFPWSDVRWVRLALHPRGALCVGIGLPGKRRLWLHEEWLPGVRLAATEIAARAGVPLQTSYDARTTPPPAEASDSSHR